MMTKTDQVSSAEERARELLSAGAAAELLLLKQERKAEERLAAALSKLDADQQRLARSSRRVERSRSTVADAAAALQSCQERRAAGPSSGLD